MKPGAAGCVCGTAAPTPAASSPSLKHFAAPQVMARSASPPLPLLALCDRHQMGRLKNTPKGKIKHNVAITRVGRRQYLKRRFAHLRKTDLAGCDNYFTQTYNNEKHSSKTAVGNYTRLNLSADPSLPPSVVAERKKRVNPTRLAELEAPTPAAASIAVPVSEQEGTMITNLMERYDTDFRAMARDVELNPFQLTAGQLQRRFKNFARWEREAFPEMHETAAQEGLVLEDFSNPSLRRRPAFDATADCKAAAEAARRRRLRRDAATA